MKTVEPTTDSPASPPPGVQQFSLAELMLGTLMLGVLLGLMRLGLPNERHFFLCSITIAGMAGWIILLAVLGKVRLLPMLAILAVLGLAFAYLGNPGYSESKLDPCHQRLRQIADAMIEYSNEHESLPPPFIADANGKPMHSWRVLLLPYLGQQKLYDQYRFDEPWDGPNNKLLHDRIVEVYRCPHDHPARSSMLARDTSYVVIVGPGNVFPGGRRNKISVADVANGDGASNTILVAEVHSSGIHWMEPRDLDFATMDFQINGKRGASISSKHGSGAMVVMVDGRVQSLDDKTSPQAVKRLITVRDRPRQPTNTGQ